jgi:UrcA family protein
MKESKLMRGIIASVALIVLSAPAIASADELKGKAVKVSYTDLNLEKEVGAKILYRRLQQASKQACGGESFNNAGSVKIMSEMKACYRTTLAAAVEEVDKAELTRIHES